MDDPNTVLAIAAAALAGLVIATLAALKGWQGWLDYKRLEGAGPAVREPAAPSPAARIEIADLKERVRKLEAIANGIE